MKEKNIINFLKTILVFLVYFIYVNCFTSLLGNNVSTIFVADLLFLVMMVILYKDSIIKSLIL